MYKLPWPGAEIVRQCASAKQAAAEIIGPDLAALRWHRHNARRRLA